jgi:alpha-amylase
MPILNLNYMLWDAVTASKVVGWSLPTTPADLWPYQKIAAAAAEYKAAGFDAALFMPSTLGAAGIHSGGYDKREDYIFDGTAWGSEAMCIAAVQALHAQGIRVYGDAVFHQMDGYPKQQYKSALFPKDPTCFAWDPGMKTSTGAPVPKLPGNVAPDSVPDPSGGWPDGDLCAYDQPNRYMWEGAIAATANQVTTLGFDGFRIDEAKDLHAPFLVALMNSPALKDLFFAAEYFDGNPYALGGYVNYWTGRRCSVLDFMFKFNVGVICNNNSKVWMGQLSEIGYNMIDAMKAVTFVENADSDTSIGEQTVWNKLLGYMILCTFPGEPMVYYRDWSDDPNCYDLKAGINNGLWIWRHLAQGNFVTRNAEFQTFAHERLGYGDAPGCVCFFNNDQWHPHTVTVQTRYGNNVRLHEYTGNAGYSADKWTNYHGQITVTIPRNVNGCNSLVYAPYL